MTYIGQQPSTTFDSGIQDRFTGLTTNTVTLNHDISAEEDILVVWNNIVQDKNTYSVGGTGNKTVTLGGTLSSSDVVTVYYLNKVMQSVNPTAGSVSSTILGSDILSGQTDIGADIADADLFLVDDGAGGTVRKSAASRLKTYIGSNTPVFAAYLSNDSDQSISDSTTTKIQFDAERIDTAGAFDTSNYKFTVPSGGAGKYFIVCKVKCGSSQQNDIVGAYVHIYKNGSTYHSVGYTGAGFISGTKYPILGMGLLCSTVIDLAASDYIEGYGYIKTNGAGTPKFQEGNDQSTYIEGFKLL